MYFARNEYDDSHMWSVMAMRNLEENTPERYVLEIIISFYILLTFFAL